jgi:hypothetical protein
LYGFAKGNWLTIEPNRRKKLLARWDAIISSLYFEEFEIGNSWEYSRLAINESISIWEKTAKILRDIRLLLKKIFGLESVFRYFRRIWQK